MMAPDLINGYAINGTNYKNSWKTEIRSVLLLNSDDRQNAAFLTHECRAEHVGLNIFGDKIYEFCIVKSWEGNFNLRHGSYNYGFFNNKNSSIYKKVDIEVFIRCDDADCEELDFTEALKFARNSEDANLFMRINYEYSGSKYVCYTPCRYINYPNEKYTEERYLQPISGYTLFHNGDRFIITYLATYITENECHIEFIGREPIGILATKPKTSRTYKILSPFRHLINRILTIDEFHKVYKVSGNVRFYRYV